MNKQWLVALGVVGAYFLGCASGESADAQRPSQWAVKCIDVGDRSSNQTNLEYLEERGNSLGADGWEIVGIMDSNGPPTVCFRRGL